MAKGFTVKTVPPKKAKAPEWDIEAIKVNIKRLIKEISFKKLKYKFIGIIPNDRKKLPNKPAYVLFGLYLVNFGPLKNFPKIKPPTSVKIQIIVINKNNEASLVKSNLILKTKNIEIIK